MSPRPLGLAGVAAAAGLALVACWSAGSRSEKLAFLPGPPHETALRDRLMVDLGTISRTSGDSGLLATGMMTLSARSPLAPEPFLVGGALAEQEKGNAKAREMYDAALRRDPRSRAAHFMLARQDFLTGRDRDGLRHLTSLSRLSPGAAPEVTRVIVGLAADPGFDRLVRGFLDDEPGQADALFAAMAGEPRLADRIFSLAPPTRPGAAARPWAGGLVTTLLAAGDTDRAVEAWVRYTGNPDPRTSMLRDGRFGGGPPPPFGWLLEGGDGGSVAHGPSGLDVEIFGDTPVRLASQLLLLGPGRYRLSSRGQLPAGALQWRVACPGLPPTDIAAGTQGDVVIPADCSRQSLELWSTPTTEGGDETAHVAEVHLDRIAS